MAYKIEDIDWGSIPEGAVEFSLENNRYLFTWYKDDGRFKTERSPCWEEHLYDDGRERYKVEDYIPADYDHTTIKLSREERLEKALSELINHHFVVSSLLWGYLSEDSLEDVDPKLHLKIAELLKNTKGE